MCGRSPLRRVYCSIACARRARAVLYREWNHRCWWCGELLSFGPELLKRGRPRRFCSEAHRHAFKRWRKRHGLPPSPTKIEARRRVLLRDGYRCVWCGRGCWPGHPDRRRHLTIDHVVAGGPTSVENMVVACRSCNSKRGGRPRPKS
ncbi:MAG: HNH endonuclease [Actinomycetota bacterium]